MRQAWDQGDADKAERLLRNLARRLEHDAPGVSATILEGLDEILTVIRLGLPPELRRALACTNAIENALGTVRTVQRNVKRWRNGRDGAALDRRRPSGGQENLPPPQGLQATPRPRRRLAVTPSRRQNGKAAIEDIDEAAVASKSHDAYLALFNIGRDIAVLDVSGDKLRLS